MKEKDKFLEILHTLDTLVAHEPFHHQKQISEMLTIIFLKYLQCQEWDHVRLKYLNDVIENGNKHNDSS